METYDSMIRFRLGKLQRDIQYVGNATLESYGKEEQTLWSGLVNLGPK